MTRWCIEKDVSSAYSLPGLLAWNESGFSVFMQLRIMTHFDTCDHFCSYCSDFTSPEVKLSLWDAAALVNMDIMEAT